MKSFSVDRAVSSLTSPALALLLALGCSSAGGGADTSTPSGGGGSSAVGSAGSVASGGSTASGGASTPVTSANGGAGAKAGSTSVASSAGGAGSSGGVSSSSIPSSGGAGKGGSTSAGGTTSAAGTTAKGGTSGTSSTGTTPAKDAGAAPDGAPKTGDGGITPGSCPTTMPEGAGTTKTGKSVYGTANGLGYGIWTNGSGGSITVWDTAHAFSASWSESQDFLAHLGLDFRPAKEWATLGEIKAEFSEVKSGTAGGFSMIGMYGWTNSPCVEWYINEDAWGRFGGGSGTAVDIDGGTYYIRTLQTNGTGGANACESGHTGTWTQMISARKTARTCGTITVSEHFAAWEKQGWKLGALTSVHINVEVGGGTGKIDFPLANVTVQNK
jgi:endo-1,4-beta-xylanase